MLEFDPLASMRIWAVEMNISGHLVRIPPLPAADWMPCLMRMDVWGVLDLVEGIDVEDALLDGDVSRAQMLDAAVKLLEQASGRTCWTTMALVSLAHRYWGTIGADLMRMSVKFDQISLGAALDCIYGALCKVTDEKGVKRLNVTLSRPPLEFQLALGMIDQMPAPARPMKQLPASAMQYVQTRPKTVLRRPQDRPDAPSVPPTPQPEIPAGSGLLARIDSPPDAAGSHPAE